MMEWTCKALRIADAQHKDRDNRMPVLDIAILADDMGLLKFIIEIGAQQQAAINQEEDDQKCYTINKRSFSLAVELGRTSMLAEMIKVRSSAGLRENIY